MVLNVLRLVALVAAVVFCALVLVVGAILSLRRQRGRHGSSGLLSSAALEMQSLLEPEKRHTLVAQRRDEEESEQAGDPPAP